jgi:molybdopterin biosynthesis enzyme
VTDIDEALDLVLSAVRPLPAEEVPLLEALGLAEVEHNPKNNRMRAI